MRIEFHQHEGEVMAVPGEKLGEGPFRQYLTACRRAGARYLKRAGGQVLDLNRLPVLYKELRAAGFTDFHAHREVREMLLGRSDVMRRDLKALKKRIDFADEVLRAEGKYLRQYQVEGAEWLALARKAILGDQQGLGKTLEILLAIRAGAPILVICPSVAKYVWRKEQIKFRPDLQTIILEGKGSFRWPAPGEMIVTSYALLPPLKREIQEAKDAGEDHDGGDFFWEDPPIGMFMIADEAHRVKNPKTNQGGRFRALATRVLKQDGSLWGATGTLLLNRPKELWSLLTTFNLHRESFESWWKFCDLFDAKKNRFGGFDFPKEIDEKTKFDDRIAERLKGVMLRRLRSQVAKDLPEKSRYLLPVDVGPAALKACDKALAELNASGIDFGDPDTFARLGKMELEFSELSRARAILAKAKTAVLLDSIKDLEHAGEPFLVFSAHRAPVDALAARKGWGSITGGMSASKKFEVAEEFQGGKYKALAVSILAAGVSLTLTRAALGYFIDLSWVPGDNDQAEDRMCRHGQSKPVSIYHLVANHVIDQRVQQVVTEKMALISATIDRAAVTKAVPRVTPAELEEVLQLCNH